MRRKPSAKVASAGVTHTKLAVEDELNWLFREQPTEDYGIDAHAEVVDGEDVRGPLLALQIKSGESWFRQAAPSGWWFRPDAEHVAYWLNHSLPVVVVLYHPETKRSASATAADSEKTPISYIQLRCWGQKKTSCRAGRARRISAA